MERKKLSIVIATTSEDKINGIREAFLQFFSEEEYEIKIYSSKTESEVADQPFGNDTYQGAYNRVNNAREKYEQALKEQNIDVDYYISCEAGINDSNSAIIKGKLTVLYSSEQIVCMYSPKKDSYFFGKSSSWTIPTEDIEEIKNTDLDQYLRKRECTGLPDVGDGKYISRKQAIIEGTKAAIASERFEERCKKLEQKDDEKDFND